MNQINQFRNMPDISSSNIVANSFNDKDIKTIKAIIAKCETMYDILIFEK